MQVKIELAGMSDAELQTLSNRDSVKEYTTYLTYYPDIAGVKSAADRKNNKQEDKPYEI